LIVRVGAASPDGISAEINQRVRQIHATLAADPIPGVVETVPAYADLTVYYDPARIGIDDLPAAIRARLARMATFVPPAGREITIPVLYGGADGPDLQEVARVAALSPDDVIARHSAGCYPVFMLGFAPGFCYLGGLDPALACPRRATPRLRVPAGSVGIAGQQTGIYPLESPGGWQIIGRTPLPLFDPTAADPFPIRPGDTLRFRPIDAPTYAALAAGGSLP
jgi:inhibitor of KinA